ncbi:MAG: enhanced intracellular survival protein Eis [Phycisphaerae bacterium]
MARRLTLEVRPPADEAECRALADLFRLSFASFGRPPEFADRCIEHIGRENLRIAKRGKHIVGGLGIYLFRQWFGGRSVASAGMSCVAVLPEARGTGVATQMMRTVVEQLHVQGVPLSSLYPSTYPIYRNAGYEPAGERYTLELDVYRLGVQDRACSMRPLTDPDREAIYALHRAYGRRNNGNVDRTPRQWACIFDLATEPVHAYVIEAPGQRRGIEGYVIYTQHSKPGAPYEIKVRDHAFVTPAAGRRLLTFFADHGTMARHVVYEGAQRDPLVALARFEELKVRLRLVWMLRVVDVPMALRERGYPAGLRAELHLEISDDLLPQNNGRFLLRVSDRAGRLRKGGRGRLKLDVRGLAPLFTGHFSAAQLASAGMLEASEADMALASAAFGGPPPWMGDGF